MAVKLSKAILPSPRMSTKEKLKVMKARQNALSRAVVTVLQERGYQMGGSLKIPGAFGFHAMRNGEATTIGIKTSSDRWVGVPRNEAGQWGLLASCQELFVVTFDDWHKPSRLQIIAFDPKKVIAMAGKVYAKAEKEGQTGLQWIPLDGTANRNATNMAAGPLLPHGDIILDEEIEWTSGNDPDTTDAAIAGERSPPRLTIAEAKAGLAATFGVSPESVTIIIEG